jgi:peptidoglycan DL-endopeptidase CwlO
VAGDSPRGGLVVRRNSSGLKHSTKRKGLLLVVALAGLATTLGGTGAATADPTISSKKDQARAIIAQIREMDTELGHAIEAYNLANVQLDRIDVDLDVNGRHLVTAKASLGIAQLHIAKRLRALYINGDSAGAIEVVLGARSLDDLLDRLDMAQTVGGHDAKVVKSVRQFRNEVRTRRAKLRDDRVQQARIVTERASRKQWIEGRLAERERLLSSVRSEIAELEAAERRRQAQLEAQARARLAAEAAARATARQQALELSSTPIPELGVTGSTSTYDGGDLAASQAPPSRYGGAVGIAMQYLGVPYVWGGASPSGFDCSGLVSYVYAQLGVSLPHNAAMQYNQSGVYVSRDQLQPGDLVFFSGLGHMGMYIGGDQFIHAPHTGDVVKISSMSEGYYASGYVGAKRVT